MATQTVVLIGGPDTGKTNFLARLWEALRSSTGALRCPTPPDDIKYVEDALGFLLRGTFAPRSGKDIEESRQNVTIPVRLAHQQEGETTILLIPDVTGELWKKAVETREVPKNWIADLRQASGAMLFVRIHSDQNRAPLDWITARALLRRQLPLASPQAGLPTQVELCELLRFLELTLGARPDGSKPRVAVCVTAYDRLSGETAARGPRAYLRTEYPLFDGRLSDTTALDVQCFGISIVGGDLDVDEEFREEFLRGDLAESGYVVAVETGVAVTRTDISFPLAWLVEGTQSTGS